LALGVATAAGGLLFLGQLHNVREVLDRLEQVTTLEYCLLTVGAADEVGEPQQVLRPGETAARAIDSEIAPEAIRFDLTERSKLLIPTALIVPSALAGFLPVGIRA
jgi:hypothetical protein